MALCVITSRMGEAVRSANLADADADEEDDEDDNEVLPPASDFSHSGQNCLTCECNLVASRSREGSAMKCDAAIANTTN